MDGGYQPQNESDPSTCVQTGEARTIERALDITMVLSS